MPGFAQTPQFLLPESLGTYPFVQRCLHGGEETRPEGSASKWIRRCSMGPDTTCIASSWVQYLPIPRTSRLPAITMRCQENNTSCLRGFSALVNISTIHSAIPDPRSGTCLRSDCRCAGNSRENHPDQLVQKFTRIGYPASGDHSSKRKPSLTNFRKSRSRDTQEQACSMAIAACWASAMPLPLLRDRLHNEHKSSQCRFPGEIQWLLGCSIKLSTTASACGSGVGPLGKAALVTIRINPPATKGVSPKAGASETVDSSRVR